MVYYFKSAFDCRKPPVSCHPGRECERACFRCRPLLPDWGEGRSGGGEVRRSSPTPLYTTPIQPPPSSRLHPSLLSEVPSPSSPIRVCVQGPVQKKGRPQQSSSASRLSSPPSSSASLLVPQTLVPVVALRHPSACTPVEIPDVSFPARPVASSVVLLPART